MKVQRYKLTKPKVYNRALRIKQKQDDRMDRLKKVKEALRMWDSIPIRWQLHDLCETLRIEPDESAYEFIVELVLGVTPIEEAAKKLPLI